MNRYAKLIFFITLFVVSFFMSHTHLGKSGLGHTYETSWGPALALGLYGKFPYAFSDYTSYNNFSGVDGEKIQKFLSQKKGCFSKQKDREFKLEEWRQQNLNSIYTYYLQMTVGLVWKVFGVCWTYVHYLVSFFYASSIVLLFFIFLLLSKSIAITILASPLYFLFFNSMKDYHIFFRDFSKVPFILLLLAMMTLYLDKLEKGHRHKTLYQALFLLLFAIITAFGIGFRTDVKALLPFPIILIVGTYFQSKTELLSYKKISKLALLVTFFLMSVNLFLLPEKKFRGDFHHTGHVAILGQTPEFQTVEQIEEKIFDSKFYIASKYLDEHVTKVIDSHSKALNLTGVSYLNQVYEKIARTIIIKDIISRPFTYLVRGSASFFVVYRWRVILLFVALFLFYKFSSTKKEFLIITLLIYLTLLSNVQLAARHYFYLKDLIFLLIALVSIKLEAVRKLVEYENKIFNNNS